MVATRPFAYNPSQTPIDGTEQLGDLAIGQINQDYSINPGGVDFWMGPEENLGYVITIPVPSGDQPTPVGTLSFVGFFRSEFLTENSFLELTNNQFNQNFIDGNSAVTWLNLQGYWTSFVPVPVTPTPSVTASQTPTPSITASQTPTPSITASQTPTVTPTLTRTPAQTPTNTPTNTRTPTPTRTQTPTPTSTGLPVASVTGATTNGGVYVSSSSPFGSGTSYLFNGTTGYLSYSAGTDFNIGTGDFTIEWFQYQTSQPSNPRVFQIGNYSAQSIGCSIEGSSASCIFYIWVPGANGVKTFTSSGNLNSWIHFAIVRIGTSLKVYQNGVQIGTTLTNSNSLGSSSVNLSVGQETNPTSNSYFPGNITQFRWTKGLGIYTGNFTTPTGPLSWTSGANPFGGVNTSAIGSGVVKVILQ
jgi:hypothetical protein